MSYESVKSYIHEHRQQWIIAGLFIVVFLLGYGTGKSWRAPSVDRNKDVLPVKQDNYTTKQPVLPRDDSGTKANQDTVAGTPQVQAAQVTAATSSQNTLSGQVPSDCPVKGNVSKQNKIYHIAGGSFYNRVKAERCFQNETEAQAAGFRKSAR